MVTIGLTGPSGAGKSAVSDIMHQHGFCVIDADKVYHDIIAPPSACLDELVQSFGCDILSSDGSLDRLALSKIVFADNGGERLELLNKITHKYVVNKIRNTIYCTCSTKPLDYVIDAPLLIEAGLNADCLFTIAVLADKDIRAKRISLRDGISIQRAFERINAQKSDDYYINECDYVVYNNGQLSELKTCIENILKDRSII